MRRILFLSLSLAIASLACGAPPEDDASSVEAAARAADPATADTRPPLDGTSGNGEPVAVRAAGLGLSVDAVATRKGAGNALTVLVRGRATRNLTGIQSYVPDDGFGDARLTGKRTFEVELRGGHEINTILSGLPLYLHLDVVPSASGAPLQYDAALELVPVLEGAVLEGAGPGGEGPGVLAPLFGRDADNPLLYRARVRASGATSLAVRGPAVPTVMRSDEAGVFLVDWAYDALAPALAPRSAPFVFAATGANGSSTELGARLSVRASRLGLTSLGVGAAWPEPTCAAETFRCVRSLRASAPDYGACGPYRAVALCASADACDVLGSPQPLALAVRPGVELLNDAIARFNAAGSSGGTWFGVSAAQAYQYAPCVERTPTLDDVTALAFAATAYEDQGLDYGSGRDLARKNAERERFFAMDPSGLQLLDTVDAYAGDTRAAVRVFQQEVPCPNCTDSRVRVVLFYEATRTVVVLDGTYGYDS